MKQDRLLLLIWFCGISGFFIVMAIIFISMIPEIDHKQIIVSEQNDLIYWSEMILLVFVIFMTVKIAYNYAAGNKVLILAPR